MHLEKGAHKYGPTITSRKKRTQFKLLGFVRPLLQAACFQFPMRATSTVPVSYYHHQCGPFQTIHSPPL